MIVYFIRLLFCNQEQMEKSEDNWNVPCSDDENYGFIEDPITGNWEPPAQVHLVTL